MAAGAENQARWNPVRVVIGPTQNPSGNTYPFGGTAIGLAQAFRWRRGFQMATEIWEDFGQVEGAHGETRPSITLACSLRGWDADAINLLPHGSKSNSLGTHGVNVTSYVEGTAISGAVILLVPDQVALGEVTVANCTELAFCLHNGVYLPDKSSESSLGYSDEFGMPVVFYGEPNTSGVMYQETVLKEITGIA